MDEVLAPVVSLATQCEKGVQYNWAKYPCKEFLAHYREAQEESKLFHYAWLLLSIVLVAWRLPEDSQFPPHKEDLPEAAWFASLYSTKDPERIKESKIFQILMEMDFLMVIN